MKTKIIYISGGELFEMAQIRAAFEEVKTTLGLDKDTILFGVPVDCDSVIEEVADNTHETPVVVAEPVTEIIPEISEISEVEEIPEIPQILQENTEEIETEDAPVVPILSVLAINDDEAQNESVAELEDTAEIAEVAEEFSDVTEPVVDIVEPVVEEIPVAEEVTEIPVVSEVVSVEDIADDDTPDMPMEKTLEQLLESMTPLREDVVSKEEDVAESANIFEDTSALDTSDTDATLAQLASEFALTEDKIAPAPRAETSGKIGKLKNILPFKKAKREDNSLMGDLFGWAGIAANDEDFSIPGFFTPAKKQGA